MKLYLSIITILFFLLISACSPLIIVGNYRGTVVDSRNGEPVMDAEVNCEWWAVHFGFADSNSSQIAEHKTKTDSKGKYYIPLYYGTGGLTGHHDGTRCIISKDGYNPYELYFSDRYFEYSYRAKTNLFIQLENEYRLDQPLKWERQYYIKYHEPIQLKDNDPRLIPANPERIAMIQQAKAAEDIIPFLNDSNVYIRQAAAKALGDLWDKRAIQPLLSAIQDTDEHVAEAAVWALGRLSDPETTKLIAPLLLDRRKLVQEMTFEIMYTAGAKELIRQTLINYGPKDYNNLLVRLEWLAKYPNMDPYR